MRKEVALQMTSGNEARVVARANDHAFTGLEIGFSFDESDVAQEIFVYVSNVKWCFNV